MKCPKCKRQLQKKANFCPSCGTKIQEKTSRSIIFSVMVLILLVGLVAAIFNVDILIAKLFPTVSQNTTMLDDKTIQKVKDDVENITNLIDTAIVSYKDEDGYINNDALNVVLKIIVEQVKFLYDSGEISDYSFSEGDTCVYFEVNHWLNVLYTPPLKDFMLNGSENIEIVTLEPNATSMYINYLTSGLKGPDEAARCVSDELDGFIFTNDLENSEISIETFTQLPNNSIVIFSGHGGYNSSIGSVLFTGISAWDEETLNNYSDAITEHAIGINQEGHFYLTSLFFDNYVEDNAYSGNLFYLGSCSSLADSRLAQSIWNKGARAIVGNTRSVWINYNFKMIYSFFKGLTTIGNDGELLTITEAVEYAKKQNGSCDPLDGSEVLVCYRDDFRLLDMQNDLNYEDNLTTTSKADIYKRYISATEKITQYGSWSENLSMTADMTLTKGKSKVKTKATIASVMNIDNCYEDDFLNATMSGAVSMSVMGQSYAWNVVCENGIAHYEYTEPSKTSVDIEMDKSCFDFGTLTEDMMNNAKLSGNKITFKISGEDMQEAEIAAVNLMSGIENLEYGDVDVEVLINKETGKISEVVMNFRASLTYQGYDAEVDYYIDYTFSQ